MIYISLPYATFALIITNGVISDAPPIARWTIGKTAQWVIKYYEGKNSLIIVDLNPNI